VNGRAAQGRPGTAVDERGNSRQIDAVIGKENGIPKAAPSDIDSELFWMREACVNIARIRARFSKKHKHAIKNKLNISRAEIRQRSASRCTIRCVWKRQRHRPRSALIFR